MRLRARLLVLIGLLLAGVLAGSFAWVFSDLRQEFRAGLEQKLLAAEASFRGGESERFRTLEVMAASLETSPSFRNVLRRTDQATLRDYVENARLGFEVDLILISDAQGALKTRDTTHPAATGLQAWAGGTRAWRDYWWLDGALYQSATVPLLDSQDYIDGYLSVALRMDQTRLERLARELDSRLELKGDATVLDTEAGGTGDSLQRTLRLGPADAPVANLTLLQSTQPIDDFVLEAGTKLTTVAAIAFLLALFISLPLVGRIAHPVEALQKAQAEMEALIQASLDGLLTLDERGTVSMANPAAGVALGHEPLELVGKGLSSLLPEQVMRELSTTPAGAHQRADFERHGRLYKVHRTFVRQRGSLQLGSILLLHDVTEDRARERQVSSFLAHLCQKLEIPESPWRVRVGLATLRAWSQPAAGAAGALESTAVDRLVREALPAFKAQLPKGRACHLEIEGDGPWEAAMTPQSLRLVLDILLDNALIHGQGEVRVRLRRDGGCLELRVQDEGNFVETQSSLGQSDSATGQVSPGKTGPGLGLPVARLLCQRDHGRLEIRRDPTCALLSLPRSAAPEAESA